MKKVLFLVFFIILVSKAQGFGLASPYLENNSMVLAPGETRQYIVEIQNTDSEDIKIKFFLESNIANITDEKEYYIIGKSIPVQDIFLNITAPVNAQPGDRFTVRYGIYPIAGSNTPVSIALKLNREFSVIIAGRPQGIEKKNLIYPIIIAVIILISLGVSFMLIFRSSHKFSKGILK